MHGPLHQDIKTMTNWNYSKIYLLVLIRSCSYLVYYLSYYTYIDITCEDCIIEQRGVASDHALWPLGVVWLGSSRHHVRVGAPFQATDSFQQRHCVPFDG